jgi:hypothetical protein
MLSRLCRIAPHRTTPRDRDLDLSPLTHSRTPRRICLPLFAAPQRYFIYPQHLSASPCTLTTTGNYYLYQKTGAPSDRQTITKDQFAEGTISTAWDNREQRSNNLGVRQAELSQLIRPHTCM